jgi:hypothetical protein
MRAVHLFPSTFSVRIENPPHKLGPGHCVLPGLGFQKLVHISIHFRGYGKFTHALCHVNQ